MGLPWSHSSTARWWRPNRSIRWSRAWAAAAGPPVVRAVGTAPLRQPVRTCQCPPWPSARGGAEAGDGELGTEHGGEPEGPGRLGEADHAVEAVVIGQGQGRQAEPD